LNVTNKETVHTREILVTLKARQSLGALPELDWNLLPDKSGLVKGKIESLLDDVYRAGAESIVDRAREAATAILSAYLQNEGIAETNGKDLGALIELLVKRNDRNGQRIVACAAEIPQRLHSRGKHVEQEKHDNLRPIREQDAELAVQCIGVMLCDLGWGRWV
jgi:HEPN domain-containing protein